MRLSPNIGEHDFQVKMHRVQGFLQGGSKVRVAVWFRGRQMAYPKFGERLLQRLAELVADVGAVESSPRLEGRNMIMILSPRKS
jgi:translation initiation factor IF-3